MLHDAAGGDVAGDLGGAGDGYVDAAYICLGIMGSPLGV